MEYGQFVDILRSRQANGDSDFFKHTVEECIRSGILADYLKKKGSEVINMLIAEYDYDMDIEVQREEAYTEGMEHGIEKGRNEKLIEQIKKKLLKGDNAEEIAEALEETVQVIQDIIATLEENREHVNKD